MPHARRVAGAVLASLLAVLGTVVMAGPAQAHNYLVSSTPAADSMLTELPETFDITTNDALLEVGGGDGAFAFQVLDDGGLYYGDGCVEIAGPTMTATPALGEPGDYTVRWQVLSADGHVVSDEFGFTWAPAGIAEPSIGSATAPVCGEAVPEASVSPSESADPTSPAAEPGASTAAAPENVSSDDTLPTVLWIGGVVIALAAAVVITLLITGRKKTG